MTMMNSLFRNDKTKFFIPWIVMIMVFVGLLTISVGLFVSSVLNNWQQAVAGSVTVQVLPGPDGRTADADATRLVNALRMLPEVREVTVVPHSKMRQLLAPWVGDERALDGLPMPVLMDVTFNRNFHDEATLRQVLMPVVSQVSQASVEFHVRWMNRLNSLRGGFVGMLSAIMALIILSLSAAIVYAAVMGMGLHKDTIYLMHIMGASDNYIAGQFAASFCILGSIGAGIGLLISLPIVLGLERLVSSLNSGLLTFGGFSAMQWCSLFAAAALAVGLCTLGSYVTVLGKLRKMF